MVSCSPKHINEPPLGYSFMPSYLDVDSIQPLILDDTSRVLDPKYQDYKSYPIMPGVLYTDLGDTVKIKNPGLLFSEKKAVLYKFYESSWERQQKELRYVKYLMREYYGKSRAAEILYQQEIERLRKDAQRSWLEKNLGYIGFGAGVITMVLVDMALLGVLR